MGKKNIIKGCGLLMRLLRKEGYMVWELKGWNFVFRHPPLLPVGAVLVTVGFFMGVVDPWVVLVDIYY